MPAGGQSFDEHLDDAVAAEADAPNKVVFRRRVIEGQLGCPGRRDRSGSFEDILFQAPAAHRSDPGAVVRQQQAGARPAIGRTFNRHQGRKHGLGWRPGRI